ncbi:MAG: radical SAM family heme chaperone HemW [Waddliaceae bacterium]
MTGNPLSLYFHIPFCTKKCPYCNFYVIPNKPIFQERLIQGLRQEWKQLTPSIEKGALSSVYFGGGTPSLFNLEHLREILSWIPDLNIEVTLEANPEDLTLEKAKELRSIGINRLSLGVQSLDDPLLKNIGRRHSAKQAIDICENAGFTNLSIDLMYDLPGQTLSTWEATLRAAVKLPITHVSLYNLTIEPHTSFFKMQSELKEQMPGDEVSLEMYKMAQEILGSHRLEQYEISAFGTPSVHNSGYWNGRNFLGLGPSAFSYMNGTRHRNICNLNRYQKMVTSGLTPIDFTETLSPLAQRREQLAIHLRLLKGVNDLSVDPECIKIIDTLIEEGFLMKNENSISLTQKGILFYDTVASEIIL